MRSLYFKYILFISIVLFPGLVSAQISQPGVPYALSYDAFKAPPKISIDEAALERARLKSDLAQGLKPSVFAWPVDTLINVKELGNWTAFPDGSRMCRMEIQSSGAFSLNIIFSKYNLPPGVKLFLYDPYMETIRGAYTSLNNKKSGKLATTPVPGDRMIIELDIPPGMPDGDPILEIERISHDFKDPFKFMSGSLKNSGDCNVDINCPEGNDWQVEKRAVAKFIRGGYWLGSGSLINNTNNDGRALFYTANHVINSQSQAETCVFYFNYERPECGVGRGSTAHSISGSDMLATSTKVDFALVELSRKPPPEYDPYFAGWNRMVASSTNNVTTIHHPAGDVKKISRRYGIVVTGNFGSGFDRNTHWHIPSWDLGTTEGGSSGAPLFDKDHKIIGDLTGGDASCDYNYNDYFQKFFVCWDSYTEPDEQLKYWLDPLDNGAIIWNGYDPGAAGKPIANFEYAPLEPRVGKELRLTDFSEGQPATWEWFIKGGSPSYSNLESPVVIFNEAGNHSVKLIVSNEFGVDSVQQSFNVLEYTGFDADMTRTVAGAGVHFADKSSGEPIYYSWKFEGGEPSESSAADPGTIRYQIPGIFDVQLIIEYPDYIDTLYYRDYIKVEPQSLIYAGLGLKTIKKEHASHVVEIDGLGWMAGSNNAGIDAFANAYMIDSDTIRMATGIRIPIGILPQSVVGTYLTAAVWDSDFNEVIRDSVELDNKPFPDYQTVWFRHPVGIDSLVYGGFLLPDVGDDIFCSKIATPRDVSQEGSIYVRINGDWTEFFDVSGLVSDLGITLETEFVFPDFKSQIKLNPVITSDMIYLDLSQLVFDKFSVHLYDILGKEIVSDYSMEEKYIEIKYLAPVSGMYLMVFNLDELSFTKKVMLIRNQ